MATDVVCTSPLIVDMVDVPALPPLPEFEDKWPRFLLSSTSTPKSLQPYDEIEHHGHQSQHQLAMPSALPPLRHVKPVHRIDTNTSYSILASPPPSPEELPIAASPQNQAPSLSDPSTHSASSDGGDDYHASVTTLWDMYYALPPSPNTSTSNPFPPSQRQSPPFSDEVQPTTEAPPIPPRSALRTANYTLSKTPSNASSKTPSKTPRPLALRSQLAPPLHIPSPHTPPPRPLEPFRHCPTPPLPPVPPSPRSIRYVPLPPPLPPLPLPRHPHPPSNLSIFPPVPRARVRARRPLTAPCAETETVEPAQKSVWEEEEECKGAMKSMRARFHVRAAVPRVAGRRRRSAGDVVRGIFAGWSDRDRGEKREKGS